MREIRLSGSEGGVALIAPSLPLSLLQLHRSGSELVSKTDLRQDGQCLELRVGRLKAELLIGFLTRSQSLNVSIRWRSSASMSATVATVWAISSRRSSRQRCRSRWAVDLSAERLKFISSASCA